MCREDDRRQQDYSSLLEQCLSFTITGSRQCCRKESATHLQLLFPGLLCLLLAAVTSIHRLHCAPGGGTHFRTAKSQGWLSPRAVLHHGCMKNPAGSARVGMGIKPFVWSYFIPNTGESGGCRSRGKCFMIAVSKCSSNQLQLACKHSQEGPVLPGNSWGHTHTNALVEFAVKYKNP